MVWIFEPLALVEARWETTFYPSHQFRGRLIKVARVPPESDAPRSKSTRTDVDEAERQRWDEAGREIPAAIKTCDEE